MGWDELFAQSDAASDAAAARRETARSIGPVKGFPGPPPMPNDWIPPDPDEILAMTPHDRMRAVHWLGDYDARYGTRRVREFEAFKNRCPQVDEYGRQCRESKHADLSACLDHVDIDELDPGGRSRRKRAAARLRLDELLDAAVDRLSEIIEGDADTVAPSVRLQAIQMLFDRSGLPKLTQIESDAHVTVHHETAADTIRARMLNLREAVLQEELRGIEAATDAAASHRSSDGKDGGGDVVDGEIVEDD